MEVNCISNPSEREVMLIRRLVYNEEQLSEKDNQIGKLKTEQVNLKKMNMRDVGRKDFVRYKYNREK